MSQQDDILELLKKMRYDLTALQGKLSDVMEQVAALPSKGEKPRCPHCDLVFRGKLSLDEHVHTSHGGPVPPHWLEAERLAGIDA